MKSTVAGAMLRFCVVLFAAAGSLLVAIAGPAHADCTQSGTTVTCTGPSPAGFDAGAQNGLGVTVQPGATVGTGITLNNNNITSNLGTISVGNLVSGIAAGANNQITSSGIITGGTGAAGISALGGTSVTNSGVVAVGDGGAGIAVAGTGSILNSGSVTAGISGGSGSFGLQAPNVTNTGTGKSPSPTVAWASSARPISAPSSTTASIVAGPGGMGIFSLGNSLTVINNGTIAFGGCGTGITAGNGSTVTNAGTITNSGCGGTGILAGNFGTTTNSGAITVGDSGMGITAGGGRSS